MSFGPDSTTPRQRANPSAEFIICGQIPEPHLSEVSREQRFRHWTSHVQGLVLHSD